uniref:Uncharacterized protein n=1 Tax=Ciona intestinalis TaxID=7719 RepID=H2XTD2_CIOIN
MPWDLGLRPELTHYLNIVNAHSILYSWPITPNNIELADYNNGQNDF